MDKIMQVNWYAVTPTGRQMLKARSDAAAIKEVTADKTWMGQHTSEIVRIERHSIWSKPHGHKAKPDNRSIDRGTSA